ncbi:MAG: acyl dehydratase [Caulobacter sp.]|nr:acyl dehydratase [Caulobacter sp.]
MESDSSSGLSLRLGTLEEGRALIGVVGPTRPAAMAVNAPFIRYFCGVVEDANPGYWSDDFANAQWGGVISPPAMLHSWAIPLPWEPAGGQPVTSISMQAPLPGDKPINVSSDAEFFEPIRVGDLLNYTETLLSISEEKVTRIGAGHFVETALEVRRQDGALVARVTNVLFRYRSPA